VTATVEIPQRSVFRAQEVCEIADVQPYVLRTWEAEFADLGVAKISGGPRLYRRGDVERVLRIKHLLFVDGLTLAGVRRRLSEEAPAVEREPIIQEEWAEAIDVTLRERLRDVRGGLQSILSLLSNAPGQATRRGTVSRDRAASNGRGRPGVKAPAKGSKILMSSAGKSRPSRSPVRKSKASKGKPKPQQKARPAPAKTKPKRVVGAKKR
jgi:DNA-binding transcriptional MerR regulator